MVSPFLVSITAIIALLALGLKSTVIVEKNEEAVVERLGSFNRLLKEGVHILIPFIEKLHGIQDPLNHKKLLNNGKISLEPDSIEFPKDGREFFGKDKARMKLRAEIVYKITDPCKAVYETAYIFDAVNQLIAGILQQRLIDAPDDSNSFDYLINSTNDIIGIANQYTKNWGIQVLEFNLLQITDGNGIRHTF